MAGGVMLGGLLQLAAQVPVLWRMGLLPRIGLSWRAVQSAYAQDGVRRILRLMAPTLLGGGVAQLSLMINTQIASLPGPGQLTWLFYADRLMEFPTALLGVALGVVLTPQLAAAKAAGDAERYSAMLDWGLRIVVLLAVPSAVALLILPSPWWLPCSTMAHSKTVTCCRFPLPWRAMAWVCSDWWPSRC